MTTDAVDAGPPKLEILGVDVDAVETLAAGEFIPLKLSRWLTGAEASILNGLPRFIAHDRDDHLYFKGTGEELEEVAITLNEALADAQARGAGQEAAILGELSDRRSRLAEFLFPSAESADQSTLRAVSVDVDAAMARVGGDSTRLNMSRSVTPTEIDLIRELPDVSAMVDTLGESYVYFVGNDDALEQAAPALNERLADLERRAAENETASAQDDDVRRARLGAIEFPAAGALDTDQ